MTDTLKNLQDAAHKSKLALYFAKKQADYDQTILDSYKKFKDGLANPNYSHCRTNNGTTWLYLKDKTSPTGVLMYAGLDYKYASALMADASNSVHLPKHPSYMR